MRLPRYRLLLLLAAQTALDQSITVPEPPVPPLDLSYLQGPGRYEHRTHATYDDRCAPSATPTRGVRPSTSRPPYLPRRFCR